MPRVPGVYDADVREILSKLGAEGVVLVVVRGSRGSGASYVASKKVSDDIFKRLPELLRMLADEMEADNIRQGAPSV